MSVKWTLLYFVVVARLYGMVTQYPIFSVFSNSLQNLQRGILQTAGCYQPECFQAANCSFTFQYVKFSYLFLLQWPAFPGSKKL